MLLAITAPQDNDRNPQYMEKVFSSILDSIDRRDHLHLVYGCYNDAVGIFCLLVVVAGGVRTGGRLNNNFGIWLVPGRLFEQEQTESTEGNIFSAS